MLLSQLLTENKGEILDAWVSQVLATYPADGARLFHQVKDPFANPVGHAVKRSLWEVYELLFEKNESEKALPAMKQLVMIRAVQDFIPSQAVSMAYLLKDVVRETCRKEEVCDFEGWLAFEEKADILAHTLFDLYMASREQLNRAKFEEYRRGNPLLNQGGCCPSRLPAEDR